MKTLLKVATLVALCSAILIGLATLSAEPIEAAASDRCSIYTCGSLSGLTYAGTCTDKSDPHCPLVCDQYRNSSGQLCRTNNCIEV